MDHFQGATPTAYGKIELPLMLAPLSRSERRRRADEVANLVRIDHRLKHRPSELSGVEQQRVAIARAIVADPPLLLCDEPIGELDRATSGEGMNILRTLCDELGKTIIMVTHAPRLPLTQTKSTTSIRANSVSQKSRLH